MLRTTRVRTPADLERWRGQHQGPVPPLVVAPVAECGHVRAAMEALGIEDAFYLAVGSRSLRMGRDMIEVPEEGLAYARPFLEQARRSPALLDLVIMEGPVRVAAA